MSDPHAAAVAADAILSDVLTIHVPALRLSARAKELRLFEGRGVHVDPPDDMEDAAMDGTHSAEDLAKAHVDVERLLREVLAAFGMAIGERRESFIAVVGGEIPPSCHAWFLLDNDVPPHAIRAFDESVMSVVLHANPHLSDSYNTLCGNTVGVHAVRLKDITSLKKADLDLMAGAFASARAAARLDPATAAAIGARLSTRPGVDPEEVVTYATTQDDRRFEAAIALILAPLFDGLVPLGANFTGKPVPDGLVLQGVHVRQGREAAVYDCKSKKVDEYDFPPGDFDQQDRYLAILDRLKEDGWATPGVLLFTPAVDEAVFREKVKKDYIRRIEEQGYGLRVVSASLVKRWHDLSAAEAPAGMRVHFDSRRFWRALMSGEAAGIATVDQKQYFPSRDQPLRILTLAEAEVAWLSGFAERVGAAADVGAALEAADPENINTTPIIRPRILRDFFTALRKRGATRSDVEAATGLTGASIGYLLANKSFHPLGAQEAGLYGFESLNRLRVELGLRPVAT